MNRRSFIVRLAVFSAAVTLGGRALAQSPHTHQHTFEGAAKWAQIFDDPARDVWQKPQEVLEALALTRASVVADIGAGTGYFSTRLAHRLSEGRVFAVDSEPRMVEYLAERARREGLKNMVALTATADGPDLPRKVDVALLVDVYHHIESRERYFRRLRNSLAPGGRIAIIDFTMDSPNGPPRSARIAPERVKQELEAAGYALAQTHTFLPNQYFLVFRLAAR